MAGREFRNTEFLVNNCVGNNPFTGRKNLIGCPQFIESTEMDAVVERLRKVGSRIIPGDWGKAESGWLAWPLLGRAARRGGGGRIHRFP